MNSCGTIYGITPQQILEAIRIIMEAQEYYKNLSAMAPNAEQLGIISKVITENENSIVMLKKLYIAITCTEPSILPIYHPIIKSYSGGLVQVKEIETRNLAFLLQLWTSVTDVYYTSTIGNIRTVVGIPTNNSYLHIINIQYILTINSCS